MKLLVLGGTRFVGRALVADALGRGWDVSALHRGETGTLPAGVVELLADREDPASVWAALAASTWDVVVDTWSGLPWVATESARALTGRVGRYGYVSSASVYEWGTHVNEESPVVAGDSRARDGDYAAQKRGAELGISAAFPDALLARAGLILGPYEDVGRLPWWLGRISRGGRIVAPGRPERPLQYVDVRDLTAWLLDGLEAGLSGAVDVSSASGHATTRDLLDACVSATGSDAQLVWCSEQSLAQAGAQPWTQLPCWVPETGEYAGFLEADASRAAATGLRCRPVAETVRDTWHWLVREGHPSPPSGRVAPGLPAALEEALLA